jgi:hypothetical protein
MSIMIRKRVSFLIVGDSVRVKKSSSVEEGQRSEEEVHEEGGAGGGCQKTGP